MNSDSTTAMMPAAMASQKHTSKAARVGTATPPTSTLIAARTPPITPEALDVPTDRNRAFSPLEAPVSFAGTERMMIIGMAANVNPMPTPMKMLATKMCHTSEDHSSTKT